MQYIEGVCLHYKQLLPWGIETVNKYFKSNEEAQKYATETSLKNIYQLSNVLLLVYNDKYYSVGEAVTLEK